MLSIEASKNAEQAKRYFRESLAVEDYYSEKAEIPGIWHGKTARMLGLSGKVNKHDFENLLDNIHPATGDQLTPRNAPNRRPLYDCTFSAPKSVSVLLALTGDDAILQAHRSAVSQAMAALECDSQTQSGQGHLKYYPATGNLAWAEFVHQTSRPLESLDDEGKKQFIPDPQLHTHATVINATWFDRENRFRAVEMGSVKKLSPYYEALYHSYLGMHMKALGFELEKTGKRWEIASIDKTIRDKFSGRTLEIEELARARGIKSARSKAQLGRLTRNEKHHSVADSVLAEIWRDRLSPGELGAIMNARGGGDEGSKGKGSGGISASRAVDLALAHFFERQSGVPAKRVLAYAIDLVSGEIDPSLVRNALEVRDDIIDATQGSIKYITTRQMLLEEERLVDRAVLGRSNHVPLHPGYEFKNKMLNEGQKGAVRHVLESRDRLMMISGDAGTGKTTLTQEIRQALRECDKELFAFAPTAEASRGQLRDKGFEHADTITRLLNHSESQEQLKNNVMLIDEAGMVGVPTMNRLMDLAEQHNARIVLSGDWKQHSAVERGDALRQLEVNSGLPVARVDEILRQRNNPAYKQIVENVARGIGEVSDKRELEVKKAYDQLDKQGHIIEIEDLKERHRRMAEDYLKASGKSPKDVILVTPTHAEGKDVTSAIREKLREQKKIGEKDRVIQHLINQHYTESEKQVASNYAQGQVVEFHQNVTGFKAGIKNEIVGKDDKGNVLVKGQHHEKPVVLPLDKFKNFEVYEKQKLNIADGDRLRISKNIRSMEGTHLFNGQNYQVTGFTQDGHLKLSNGKTLHKNAMHIGNGYYQTSHSAQGKDAKTVLVAQSSRSLGASHDKQFYVTISRGSENLRVYTDDKQSLREAVARSGDRMSAGEIAQKAKLEQLQQERRQQQAEYMRRVRGFQQRHVQPYIEKLKTQHEREKGQINRTMDGPARA